MNNGNVNYEALHQFFKGFRKDFDDHAENPQSYFEAENGRLYSHNGVLSFGSPKGTVEVYNNPEIIKYLGYWAFKDELVIFVKHKKINEAEEEEDLSTDVVKVLTSQQIIADIPFGSSSVDVSAQMDNNTTLQEFEVPTKMPPIEDPFDFDDNFSCLPGADQEINYLEYYTEKYSQSNHTPCFFEGTTTSYENNKTYIDAIYSLKINENGQIYGTLLWYGFLNWPMDGKIVTLGIYENNYYKRVYFTDYQNPFRVINLKDPRVKYRNPEEFDSFQNSILLQPKIENILTDGSIKAGSVFYAYRLITLNGQSTEFSPFSFPVRINKDDGNLDYSGGDISEVTNKHVQIKCNVPEYENFEEIEAVAVEYEAKGAPTSIRSLGIKKAAAVNFFDHYGNESQFSDNIALSDLLERKNTWRYCSSLTSKSNNMLASGLRNDPLPAELLKINKDFALHAWDINGETHDCLMNPDPTKYRFIDPSNTDDYYYVKQKLYHSIQVFGNFTVELRNQDTAEFVSKTFDGSEINYQEYLLEIFEWLDGIQGTQSFQDKFPNLQITYVDNKMLFSPINAGLQTNFDFYNFSFNTTQVIQDIDEDIEFINFDNIDPNNMLYGAVSLGYNQGNGIRLTFKHEAEVLLEKSFDTYPEEEPLMRIKKPTLRKGFMKGEIYRLGLQVYDQDGYQLFTIPLGDIKIPEIGETQKYLGYNDGIFTRVSPYRNSYTTGTQLWAERLLIKADVRFSCEMQKLISMYQLVAVERNEENRTILCQGISAPLERCNTFRDNEHIDLRDEVDNKWNLPYFGGPTYDWRGLQTYDDDPYQEPNDEWPKRIVTHRALMYFDSPDIIYNKISDKKIENGFIQRIGRLNTDHTPTAIRQSSGEVYFKFSRKIYKDEFGGINSFIPNWMNVSVFSKETLGLKNLIPIESAATLAPGEVIPGIALNVPQEISNNALTLAKQSWFYSGYARNSEDCGANENGARSELFNSNNVSRGYKTTVIKASEDVFTNAFINQNPFSVNPEVRDPYNNNGYTYDTHALINIKLNNESSVYGGRTELAFSKNVYIPLSETIPVLKTSNAIQEFFVQGDVYTTLYPRLKNDFGGKYEPELKTMNNSGGCENRHEENDYSRWGAWAYAFVVESQVEPKITDKERFWRESQPFDFLTERSELINEAYFQENNLRTFIPRPFRYKDDPNMGNIVAASQTKLRGDFIDSWTEFPVNNFYELERDKGVAFNLAKDRDKVYVVQERQTSEIYVNAKTFVPSDNGEIRVQQGDGTPISDHKVISNYGTSIRRAIGESDFGFVFFDETKVEFVKVQKPLFVNNSLALFFRESFRNNPVIDTEAYYDDEFKESNIRLRNKNGDSIVISYNEALEVFNGKIEYNNDLFLMWNQNVYAPKRETGFNESLQTDVPDNSSLHQLNVGPYLNFFDEQKTLKLGVVCNINPNQVKIFKHWAGVMNIKYNIKRIDVETSRGQTRAILGTHDRYRIREGTHSVPLKNQYDFDDLRGEWMKITVEIESLNNSKIDIFSFINFVRHSYQ